MKSILYELPAYEQAIWGEGGVPLNAPDAVKWSGKAPPPALGAVVKVRGGSVLVSGYEVAHGWLMIIGYREDDPNKALGNLAGAEIKA